MTKGSAMKPWLHICNIVPREAILACASKFWTKIEKTEEKDGCWIWTATTRKNDGSALWLFNHGMKRYRIPAHRASLIIHGVTLDAEDVAFRKEKCRNVLCVNPEHLGVGGHEDNVRARGLAGNTARGEENGRAKLTEEDVAEIKLQLRRGTPRKELAEYYGVDTRAIWGIAAGRVWKHVEAKAERYG